MWKQSEGNQHYYLGKYKVGAVFQDEKTTGEEGKYKVNINLVGLKNYVGHFITLEEGMTMLELVVDMWLINSELKRVD
jgi:hypothetical protein